MGSILVACDVGGTFTDAVALSVETGERSVAKAPTTPGALDEGVTRAVTRAIEQAQTRPGEIDRVVHGTTTATNALLEDDLAPTALVTNAGFEDVLEIGRQDRPSLYDLDVVGPAPVVPRERRFGVPGRLDAEGRELDPVDLDAVDEAAEAIAAGPAQAVAVCMLHAHRSGEHEAGIADRLRDRLPEEVRVATSHGVSPEVREVERFTTTVVNAALRPRIEAYISRLTDRLASEGIDAPVQVLDSAGGLVDPAEAARLPVRLALSGPAGGVTAVASLSTSIQQPGLLGVDMGGTSTDVSLVIDGTPTQQWATEVAGRRLQLPAADVHTIGAGGGSIAWLDDAGGLRVGPRSAGAKPGPACYGRGGTAPTLTDANVALDRLPAGTQLPGGLTLDRTAAREALDALASRTEQTVDALAQDILQVATANAVRGIRVLTARHAADPGSLALVAFGGAGPQVGAEWATRLGIDRVVVPRHAGVTSADGLCSAPPRVERSASLLCELDTLGREQLVEAFEPLAEDARKALGVPDARIEHRVSARYAGQSHELTVVLPELTAKTLRARFEAAHEDHHGYRLPKAPIEVVTVRVRAVGTPAVEPVVPETVDTLEPAEPTGHVEAWFSNSQERARTRLVDADGLEPGHELPGPVIVRAEDSTVLVPPGWHGRVHGSGHLALDREEGSA